MLCAAMTEKNTSVYAYNVESILNQQRFNIITLNQRYFNVELQLCGCCERDVSIYLRLRSIRPREYKTFFMLNSVEHEILNAHMYKNSKRFGFY